MTLSDALRLESSPSGDAIWTVPDGWQQGRATFGGLTLAALAWAASRKLRAGDRPLRTITAEIPGALVPGAAVVRVRSLREGNSLSAIAAEVAQGDGVAAHAVLNFGKTRDVGFDRAPTAAPPMSFESAPRVGVGPVGPTFTQHFEYRLTRGIPLAGEADAIVEGWVRLREPGDVPPSVALLAMVDAWFPSVLPVLTEMRPFGTISFAAHLFDRAWLPGEPLFHRARLLGSQQGYFAELRELYTAKGELFAVNQQTMAIIK